MVDYSQVPDFLQRAISLLRGKDTRKIEYTSKGGYKHTIRFEHNGARRVWTIDHVWTRPLSVIAWKLTEDADKDSIRVTE
jgi:hypothetical protein